MIRIARLDAVETRRQSPSAAAQAMGADSSSFSASAGCNMDAAATSALAEAEDAMAAGQNAVFVTCRVVTLVRPLCHLRASWAGSGPVRAVPCNASSGAAAGLSCCVWRRYCDRQCPMLMKRYSVATTTRAQAYMLVEWSVCGR